MHWVGLPGQPAPDPQSAPAGGARGPSWADGGLGARGAPPSPTEGSAEWRSWLSARSPGLCKRHPFASLLTPRKFSLRLRCVVRLGSTWRSRRYQKSPPGAQARRRPSCIWAPLLAPHGFPAPCQHSPGGSKLRVTAPDTLLAVAPWAAQVPSRKEAVSSRAPRQDSPGPRRLPSVSCRPAGTQRNGDLPCRRWRSDSPCLCGVSSGFA